MRLIIYCLVCYNQEDRCGNIIMYIQHNRYAYINFNKVINNKYDIFNYNMNKIKDTMELAQIFSHLLQKLMMLNVWYENHLKLGLTGCVPVKFAAYGIKSDYSFTTGMNKSFFFSSMFHKEIEIWWWRKNRVRDKGWFWLYYPQNMKKSHFLKSVCVCVCCLLYTSRCV